jgi:hypothetical protein
MVETIWFRDARYRHHVIYELHCDFDFPCCLLQHK